MISNRYFKNLLGFKGQILVAPAVEYAANATYADFVANAAVGALGVYNADTGALISGLGAVGATVPVFIAVKRNQTGKSPVIYKTTPFKVGELSKKTRTAYAAAVNQVTTITAIGAPVAGNNYNVLMIDETPGAEPFPTWNFNVTAATGETVATLTAKFVAQINDASSFQNKHRDLIVTAAAVGAGNIDLQLTGKLPTTKFKVLVRESLTGTITTGTKPFIGVGTPDLVSALEKLGEARHGITTNYPTDSNATPEEFGKPDATATAGGQFNIYEFLFTKTDRGLQGPNKTWSSDNVIVLAVQANGAANAEAEVKAIFGL